MTKTQNYQLPQWEASDALKRGDFNEAMETIDTEVKLASAAAGAAQNTAQAAASAASAAYSSDNKPYAHGSGYMTADFTVGTAFAEFDFEPSFAILFSGSTVCASQLANSFMGISTAVAIATDRAHISDPNYDATFLLDGNKLKLTAKGSAVTGGIALDYVAFR